MQARRLCQGMSVQCVCAVRLGTHVWQSHLPFCREHGIKAKTDSSRGFDHAVFVPLLGLMPEADIPVVAVSVISSMDPKVRASSADAAIIMSGRL